ncbi:MAG TPA: hypothetical protein VMJ32_14545 [Pirellulales bacterium]|nr:hypothetical protein [Pirellulales bacterium]
MNSKRFGILKLAGLWLAMLVAPGCMTTHPKSEIPKPSHVAATANDFPTAIEAGIPASNVKK